MRQYVRIPVILDRRRLNLEIDAHNLLLAFFPNHPRTLAQFRKADVRTLAEFKTRRNQDAVDLQARPPFKLKENIDQARVTRAPAQYPASATENRTSKGLHCPARFVP
jgi:hypothetical protein